MTAKFSRDHMRKFLGLPVNVRLALLERAGVKVAVKPTSGSIDQAHVATVDAITLATESEKDAILAFLDKADDAQVKALLGEAERPVGRLLDADLSIQRVPVNSSNVTAIGESDGITQIWFSSGGTYRYVDPDGIGFETLAAASESGGSVGRTFAYLRRKLMDLGAARETRSGWVSAKDTVRERRQAAASRVVAGDEQLGNSDHLLE